MNEQIRQRGSGDGMVEEIEKGDNDAKKILKGN